MKAWALVSLYMIGVSFALGFVCGLAMRHH